MNGTNTPCAYVTGADHGLGLSLVRELAERGFRVFAGQYSPNEYGLNQAKTEYPKLVKIVPLDVADDYSVQRAAAMVRDETGSLELVINNAAILGDADDGITDDVDIDQVNAVINTNASGPLRVMKSTVDLVKNGSSKLIVNISSEAGSIGNCWRKGWFGYCMSKAALNMASMIVQNSLRKEGVRVFCLHPGYLRTYMMGSKNMDAKLEPEEAANMILDLLLERDWPIDEAPYYVDNCGEKLPW